MIEQLDLGMIPIQIIILTLASLASALHQTHHNVNSFVPSNNYGKEQLQNENLPHGFEVKSKQVVEQKNVTLPTRGRFLER